MTAKFK